MFTKTIYSSPKAPGIELHTGTSPSTSDRVFSVIEKGKLVVDDLTVPDGMTVEHFVEGFFAGVAYQAGELRKIRGV